MIKPLLERLEPYGARAETLVDLQGKPSPETIRYLDLMHGEASRSSLPNAVVEAEFEPLAYVIDATEQQRDLPSLQPIRRKLALRGDAPYLAILEPGRLSVYDVGLDEASLGDAPLKCFENDQPEARTAFARLHVDPFPACRSRRWIEDVIFDLFKSVVEGLAGADISIDDALSLAGRALFVRFLLDRKVLRVEDIQSICPGLSPLEDLFGGPQQAEATCRWLDRTFNGDFLPLSFWPQGQGFAGCDERVFYHLSNVMHRAPGGQQSLDWGILDFAHVPVGVLSQVYEWQAGFWNPANQRQQSIYYTPRRLAEFMVREVFAGLREQGPVAPHEARILDPAVGGAVFLVSAFEEIAAAWWKYEGKNPDTIRLRSILYEQLAGFDVSEPSLRLAALSLYLKAIELDLDPHPVEKLRFKPLRGKVLHDVRDPDFEIGAANPALGSLGRAALGPYREIFDVVLGNPPWTALRGERGREIHGEMVSAIRPIATRRLGEERAEAFQIPDRVPDLPFVWRAMEWARHGGWLAFALHGRLLFKTSKAGRRSRADLFEALTITGVLNGADLRNTLVWPRVTAPFCLLFARNEKPAPHHAFHFVSPYWESTLNDQGRFRIDAKAAQPVSLSFLLDRPELFKTLFRGTALDARILAKVQAKAWPTLLEYWKEKRLAHSQGYQVAAGSQDASFLLGLPNLTTTTHALFVVDPKLLPRFERKHLHRPRGRAIYRAPLLLVRKSPPEAREEGRALVSFQDIAYNESFYGYSACGHSEGQRLAKLLLILVHSRLFLWHALMTSSEFGIERESLQKQDVESFLVPRLEDLSPDTLDEIDARFEALVNDRERRWEDLDAWVADLYGLDRWEHEVICDTLSVSLPFRSSRKRAQRPPTLEEIERFFERFEREVHPFLEAAEIPWRPGPISVPRDGPWKILSIDSEASKSAREDRDLDPLLEEADRRGASQLVIVEPGRRLRIAILRQYRYWTPTRARLCALEVVQEHLEHLDRRS